MSNRRKVRFVLAALGLLMTGLLARADDRPRSHVPLPIRDGQADPEQLFQDRLRQIQKMQDLNKRFKDILGQDADEWLKVLKQANINPNDPEFIKLMKEEMARQARNGKNPNVTPEQLEDLKRLLKDLFPDGKLPSGIDPKLPSGSRDKDDPIIDKIKPLDPPDLGKKDDASQPPVDPAALADSSDRLRQLAEWLKGQSAAMNESPALRQALGDLSKLALEHSTGRPGGLDTQFARLQQMSRSGDSWFNRSWSSLRRFELPKLPAVSLPSFRFNVGLPSMGRGSSGFSGAAANPAAWQGVLWVLVLVALLVLTWKLVRRYMPLLRVAGTDADEWRLGPWPVQPGAVGSRADLVRAFEYLSLLLLGRPARAWNHREIASRLGADADDRRRAADQLATLYEKARYAPDTEPITSESLADARRDLCFLAGMAAS